MEAETAEQRDPRLERLREAQQEWLAAETAEQREARQWHDRDRHSECSVQTKILHFHRQIALLSCSHCTTCNEEFPGLRLGRHCAECMCCSQDKCIPKLYPSDNNMDPGSVPPSCRLVYSLWLLAVYYTTLMCSDYIYSMPCISSQGLTQVEEMLISVVLPIMSLYQLPHGQFAYNGHVINLPQDIACFANS